MNMLIGVLCDMITSVSQAEKDRMQVSWVKDMLEDKFRMLDVNNDDMVSRNEFLGLVDMPEVVHALEDVGVDVVGVLDLADFIFDDEHKTMTFPNFMEIMLDM